MQKKKIFTIFLLFFGKYVFVGKTTSPRISAVYHRHKRGEVYATRVHALKNAPPSLHILHVEEMLAYEAYYWILACVHILMRAGYTILNNPRTIARANNLYMPAQSIVAEIEAEGIDQILARTKVERSSDADRQQSIVESGSQKCLVDNKIDIRLTAEEKARFIRAAKKRGLTYRELIRSLLNSSTENTEHTVEQPTNSPTKTERLESNIRELQEKARAQRVEFNERLSAKKKQLQLIQVGLATYFDLMRPTHNIPLALERNTYKDFPGVHRYQYPGQEGAYIVRVTALLYGRNRYPARFILGVGDNNVLYKFRFYPNSDHIGISLTNDTWGKRGSVWLLVTKRAQDDAMDICGAFPLDISFRYTGIEEYGSESKRYIADFLHEAEECN